MYVPLSGFDWASFNKAVSAIGAQVAQVISTVRQPATTLPTSLTPAQTIPTAAQPSIISTPGQETLTAFVKENWPWLAGGLAGVLLLPTLLRRFT
jgi:hypothetical protein